LKCLCRTIGVSHGGKRVGKRKKEAWRATNPKEAYAAIEEFKREEKVKLTKEVEEFNRQVEKLNERLQRGDLALPEETEMERKARRDREEALFRERGGWKRRIELLRKKIEELRNAEDGIIDESGICQLKEEIKKAKRMQRLEEEDKK
jgi:hypothetical protein